MKKVRLTFAKRKLFLFLFEYIIIPSHNQYDLEIRFLSDSHDNNHNKHSQVFGETCLDFYTVSLFENVFTQMLCEVYKSSNAFNYLELCVTIKNAQIGLTDVTSGIPNLNLGQTNTNYNSQSWDLLLHWGGFSLGALGFSEKAKVVFIWFIFNMSCCLT